jgi:hypothetical protein
MSLAIEDGSEVHGAFQRNSWNAIQAPDSLRRNL